MRKAFAILFTVVFAHGIIYNAVVISYYTFAKKQFIEQFCTNKDKPELECNGKCMLAKSMSAIVKKESNSETVPAVNIKLSEIVAGFIQTFDDSQDAIAQENCHNYYFPESFYASPSTKIHHPPPNFI